ncbi:MAG: 5-formyltetrahydrofolate cyclo-ligase [Lachnospiraceae bacterium]|nr:5-formyltetrahydrofolate cyclo-ligase [Lachnospiraceae bacterium]
MNEKQELRNQYLKYRDSLSLTEINEKSQKVIKKLRGLPDFQKADTILTYVECRSEVRTTEMIDGLLAQQKKRVFCPKVIFNEIEFYEITSLALLKLGYKGIKEPEDNGEMFVKPAKNCLIIMPGVAFSKNRGRLGYGKGFYDRFLTRFPGIKAVALAYECQIAKSLPSESHDKCPDLIVTETRIIK